MGIDQDIGTASAGTGGHVLAALVQGLEMEFGRGAGEGLAQRFLEAEEVDFRWGVRIEERWLGACDSVDDDDLELDRVSLCGQFDGHWFCATMIVDGDGRPHEMTACRTVESRALAREAMLDAR